MGYYSVLKTNELLNHEKKWISLKCVLQSENSNLKMHTYCMIPNIGHSGKHKTMETVNGSVVGMSYEWCSVGGVDEYVEHREFFRVVKILCMRF